MQEVGVDGEGRLAALVLGDEDLVLLGEVDQVGARLELPFPPRRDDADVGVEGIGRQLEAHLVVALAGGAVRDGVRAASRAISISRLAMSGRAIDVPSR